jgi:hypothetical protein
MKYIGITGLPRPQWLSEAKRLRKGFPRVALRPVYGLRSLVSLISAPNYRLWGVMNLVEEESQDRPSPSRISGIRD